MGKKIIMYFKIIYPSCNKIVSVIFSSVCKSLSINQNTENVN